jgi:hypothetical protein
VWRGELRERESWGREGNGRISGQVERSWFAAPEPQWGALGCSMGTRVRSMRVRTWCSGGGCHSFGKGGQMPMMGCGVDGVFIHCTSRTHLPTGRTLFTQFTTTIVGHSLTRCTHTHTHTHSHASDHIVSRVSFMLADDWHAPGSGADGVDRRACVRRGSSTECRRRSRPLE